MINMTVEKEEISRKFIVQSQNKSRVNTSSAQDRIAKLKKIRKWIYTNRQTLRDALYADLGKPELESDLWEGHVVITEISHAIRHLKKWMRKKYVKRTLLLASTRSYIQYKPAGVVLIIAPWNFPFMLTLGPLISAIAAGNCIIIKPSEIAVHTSKLINDMIMELFPENEISVVAGDKYTAQELLKKPFDHIFFTGSIEVGKLVMKSAAENLSTITLELGGKSPVIVDESANIRDTAGKLVWSKFSNSGHACIAPDYVLVAENVEKKLLFEMKNAMHRLFGQTQQERHYSPDLARIIDIHHFDRLAGLLDNAVNSKAEVFIGGHMNKADKYIEPTILTGVNENDLIMKEEIFGPLLPVISYDDLNSAIACVNKRTKPLAIYIFSKNRKNIDYILKNTYAGGGCINDVLTQFIHPNLPFGGVNHSGIGNAHGFAGFKAFSHEQAIVRNSKFSTIKLIIPPYNRLKRFIAEVVYRYL
jgi:aldehyde dehydrogenase (NAD+)